MEERQQHILQSIIERYIATAEPVGSKTLVDEHGLELSPATVRNEMHDLEELGYLDHPHTSAGRIPTEKAYRFYVDRIREEIPEPTKDEVKRMQEKLTGNDEQANVKQLAKGISEMCRTTAIVAFDTSSLYYSGISFLFSQPEFAQFAHAASISQVFDHCEERLPAIYRSMNDDVVTLIGNENPLGALCSLVGAKFSDDGLFLLLGPMRMDYRKHMRVVRFVAESLK